MEKSALSSVQRNKDGCCRLESRQKLLTVAACQLLSCEEEQSIDRDTAAI